MAIKHAFTNPKSDGADATITRPSDWNADHVGSDFVLLQQQTASSSAQLDFESWYSSTYDDYQIRLIGLQPATNLVDFYIRFGLAATYDTGSNYTNNHYLQATTGNVSVAVTTTSFKTRNNGEISNGAAHSVDGVLNLRAPGSTALEKRMYGMVMWSGGTNYINTIADLTYTPTTAIDSLRFYFSSGNISVGKIRIYGVGK